MTREEIREGLAEVLSFSQLFDTEWNDMEESAKQLYEKQATIVLSYLHSQGVVIKVGNGLYGYEDVGSGVKVESLISK